MDFISKFFVGLIFTISFSIPAFSADWKYVYCQAQGSSSYLEIQLSGDRKLTVKANESVHLLFQVPCLQVSSVGPYVRCTDDFGTDVRQFYSYSRIENGFINYYSNELVNEKVNYFVFERSFENASGQYTRQKREFKFRDNECVWE